MDPGRGVVHEKRGGILRETALSIITEGVYSIIYTPHVLLTKCQTLLTPIIKVFCFSFSLMSVKSDKQKRPSLVLMGVYTFKNCSMPPMVTASSEILLCNYFG